MKIKSVRIENLRSIKDETIYFNDYSCMVGPNGAGKSTVLCALNIFFRETGHSSVDLTSLQEEDFHLKDTSKPITITVTFVELNEEAQEDFKDYYRQGELVVTSVAQFDRSIGKANIQQYGQRNAMTEFAPFFQACSEGKSVQELKAIYRTIQQNRTDVLAATTKQAMIDALHQFEEAHPEHCELIPSSDQFYGVSKGVNRLEKYIQWVFIPAVKDANTEDQEERNTALGRLLSRTVRSKAGFSDDIKALQNETQNQYAALLESNQAALDEVSTSLTNRIAGWATQNSNLKLVWQSEPGRSVRLEEPFARIVAGEGVFSGRLARFGHGFQRCYLLALLQELAGIGDAGGPRLILGFEEPELFQHPPQAQHLSDVLYQLSHDNTQVMVCTHSPYFVTGQLFEDVRMVRKHPVDGCSQISQVTFQGLSDLTATVTGNPLEKQEGVLAKIHQALQPSVNEMFFSPFLILVEGLEDVAYITSYLHLLDLWPEWRALGCHIVPTGGKSLMIQPRAVARLLCIPTFTVFDSDGTAPDNNGSKAKHEKDNTALLKLCGVDDPNPFPDKTLWGEHYIAWESTITELVRDDYGAEDLKTFEQEARQRNGQIGGLGKNSLYIADLLSIAWDHGKRSVTLERLCNEILNWARQSQGCPVEEEMVA